MNNNETGVSILMPIYNGIEFLEDSLTSIILQQHTKWQLIIGINGHPIGSDVEKRANDIRNNYDKNLNIIIKHYNVKGKSKTLNLMVNDTIYDFIALLDVDDLWTPDKLVVQIPYLFDYDIVGTKCTYFGNLNFIPNIPTGDLTKFDFMEGNPIINSSVIIKKEDAYWDENEITGLEDYDMWYKLSKKNKTFFNIALVTCYHRIHEQSAFNNSNDGDLDRVKRKWINIKNNNDV